VNAAMGRGLREQAQPGESDLVQVEFPLLPETPVRLARVVKWMPPHSRAEGGDVAGLMLTEVAPVGAWPARFAAAAPEPGTRLRVLGYPGRPPRDGGMWVDLDLKGEVGGQLLQVESRHDQTVKTQPGYSGSPVWDDSSAEVVGLLQAAPFADEPERDASLLPPLAIARVWEEPFDYLLVPENPYRALEPFTAEHAAVFFGRDADIAALAERVRAQPVLVVVGPSGVGKSSLVQAGLVPALQREQPWSVALMRPGQDPWLRLAEGLLVVRQGDDRVVTLEDTQREVARLRAEGLDPLGRFLRSQNRPLLVVVDQFEEVLAADEPPDQDLLNLLLPPPGALDAATRLVLTLRADFLPVLQSIPGFHARLNERLYLLSPLTAGQMRQAVTCPASAHGVGFEPGLADQILSDTADGSLPLLEFTLTKLWETQRGRTLTFAGYHQMGRVYGALDAFAEEKAVQLAGIAVEVLDHVLLKLVRTGGSSDLLTRRHVLKSEVSAAEWDVLRLLASARLVVLGTDAAEGEPYAELAHDSLITAWQRLRDLVTENIVFLDWLTWVRQRAAEKDPLPEARIAEARRWLGSRPGDVPDDVRRFIDSSETAAEARLRELREARDRAEASARRAEALRLAADAELAIRSGRPAMVIALALAAESLLTLPNLQGDLALRQVLRLHARTLIRIDHEHPVNAVAFSPDGSRIATGCGHDPGQGSASVFDAATGAPLAQLDHERSIIAVAFSPDGSRVATVCSHKASWEMDQYGDFAKRHGDRSVRVFNSATGEQVAQPGRENLVTAVVFSPDGSRIATISVDSGVRVFNEFGERPPTGGDARSVQVFNVATGEELAGSLDDTVSAVAFSPNSSRIAVASGDRSVRVFDLATGEELPRLDHDQAVSAAVFSPDGSRIATIGIDRVRVFDLATGEQRAQLEHDDLDHHDAVCSAVFSPDGAQIATTCRHREEQVVDKGVGCAARTARVFDGASGKELVRLNHNRGVNALVYSPDGAEIATTCGNAGAGGSARWFDAASGAELARLDHDNGMRGVEFSPDGTRIATVDGSNRYSGPGSAQLCTVSTGVELARLDHDREVNELVFSPDGSWIATASGDGSVRVFDAVVDHRSDRLNDDGFVKMVAFSPDGSRIASASRDGSVRVFDAVTEAQVVRLDSNNELNAMAFSPDGSRIATASGRWGFKGWGSGSVQVFDAVSGNQQMRFDYGAAVHVVVFSPDGSRIATVGAGESALVIDLATEAELVLIHHDRGVNAVAFSPDGTRIITGGRDGSARVIDIATGEQLARLDPDYAGHPDYRVNAVAFSPDGTRIATGGGGEYSSGSARVFDAATWTELTRLDHDYPVNVVAFSPDGTRIATASGRQNSSGSARVFDAATAAELIQADHEDAVNVVVFSRDGSRIATASSSYLKLKGLARIFDAATGEELTRLNHDGKLTSVVFSPDGTRIATASGSSAQMFEIAPELLLQRAFGVMTRPLNPTELRRYSLAPDCKHVKEWRRKKDVS
jgi:WD40 repeat protein